MLEVDPELHQFLYLQLLLFKDAGQTVTHGTGEEEVQRLTHTLIQLRLTAARVGWVGCGGWWGGKGRHITERRRKSSKVLRDRETRSHWPSSQQFQILHQLLATFITEGISPFNH